MSISQYSENQLEILNKGLEKVNELFALLGKFEPMIESSHAAMRLQEGFMWLEQVVKNGVIAFEEIKDSITPSPVDENKK